MGDFVYTPGGGVPGNPSSTQGSYNPWVEQRDMNNAPVFMGKGNRGEYRGSRFYSEDYSKFYSKSRASALFGSFSKDESKTINSAYRKAKANGYSGRSAQGLWNLAVEYAAADPGGDQTPWDYINDIVGGGSGPGGGGGGGYSGPTSGTNRSTTTSVDLTSKTEADRLIDSVLSTYLGKTASESEKKKFLAVVNKAERANPTTTTGTERWSQSGGSRTSNVSQTSKGGVDQQQVAIDMAEADKGFAEYQYGTTYYDAFLSALGAPVSGV